MQAPENFFDKTIAVGNRIHDGRTPQDVMISLVSEVGELAEEVNIRFSTRATYKLAGPDGVIGESVDVILCVMDLLHLAHPDLTHDELMGIANVKLAKWYNKSTGV